MVQVVRSLFGSNQFAFPNKVAISNREQSDRQRWAKKIESKDEKKSKNRKFKKEIDQVKTSLSLRM
jgi:hypothetical protein